MEKGILTNFKAVSFLNFNVSAKTQHQTKIDNFTNVNLAIRKMVKLPSPLVSPLALTALRFDRSVRRC
jgi:hypothetical protein